jgi:hypothetical protein
MPKKVTREQRDAVLRLLAVGQDRDTFAAAARVTVGQALLCKGTGTLRQG